MNEFNAVILMYCSTIPNTTDYQKFEIFVADLTHYDVAYALGLHNVTFKVADIPRDEYNNMIQEFENGQQIQNESDRKAEINRLITSYRKLYPVNEENGELCPVLNRNLRRIEYGQKLIVQDRSNAIIFKFVSASK